jgi:hypothetical protein
MAEKYNFLWQLAQKVVKKGRIYFAHGLWTPNEGLSQTNLKWSKLADKEAPDTAKIWNIFNIIWQHSPHNFGPIFWPKSSLKMLAPITSCNKRFS